jgi:RNA polymerase sigma-70 factor (ECF subfamily)
LKIVSLYPSEKILIDQLLAKNPGAQKELYQRFSPKMLGVCMRYIKDLQYAEDVLLEGFLKVFDKLDSFTFKGSFEGWLRQIFVRASLDFIRRNKNYVLIDFEGADAKVAQEFSNESGFNDLAELSYTDVSEATHESFLPSLEVLLQLLETLPHAHGLVFNLYVLDSCSHKEIASILDISEANSKALLSRARKHLQKEYEVLKTKTHGKVRI